MATADEYAAWIVKNSDKRGTAEFDTVAKAYELAKGEETTARTQQQLAPAPQEPGIGQQIVGAGETALTLGTGAVGGTLGTLAGTLAGLSQQILSGQFGTPEAMREVEKAAAAGAQALTYQPRTQAGQEMTQAVGKALGDVLPPVLPMIAAPGSITQAARQAAPIVQATAQRGAAATTQAARAAGQAVARPIQAATTAAREALGMEVTQPTTPAGARVSGGAAATPGQLERVTTAEGLPVPVALTKGAASREAEQLAFEKEQMKGPLGAPLRNRAEENNLQIMQNFDALIDKTGAEAAHAGPSATGSAVVDALSSGWQAAKNRVNVLYKKAEQSPEARAIADTNLVITLGEGDNAITGSLIDYVNNRNAGVEPKVAQAARQQMIRFGIADVDADGNLVAKPATVKQLEDFRSEMSGAADLGVPRQIRDETIIKKLVDATTEPVAGPLFREARAARTEMGRKYENRAIVARLIKNRKGMDDPQVAVDQIFQRSIIGGSPEEITFLKRVLQTSGQDGQQAWKELQAATIQHIRDEATKGVGSDSAGRPLVSPAKLNQVVSQLDKNGRLDIMFGKQQAQVVRDLNEVTKYISTVPPGTLVNTSGTAGTILAAIAETGVLGGPYLTGARQISKMIKSGKTKAKINEALNALPAAQTPAP